MVAHEISSLLKTLNFQHDCMKKKYNYNNDRGAHPNNFHFSHHE